MAGWWGAETWGRRRAAGGLRVSARAKNQSGRVGKGAFAPCPPIFSPLALRWARFALPTLQVTGFLYPRSVRRHHVGVDPAARHRGFTDAVAVIARDHDRIALGVDAGDDADMAAAAPAHDGDGADLRTRYAPAVARE